MTRLEKLASDRQAILAGCADMLRVIEAAGREPTVYEDRAFRDRIAAADRLQATIAREQVQVPV